MDTLIQTGLLIVGAALVLSAYGGDLWNYTKKLWENVDMPDIIPDSKPEKDEVDLAYIINEWEDFLNLLVENDLPNCAAEVRKLGGKIFAEYRDDLDNPAPPK